MALTWHIKEFSELSPMELYIILKARGEVFIVEQNCPYLDPDGYDPKSIHVFATGSENSIAAYCRILPKNTKYPENSIGRVITTAGYRSQGLGKTLMETAIHYIHSHINETKIRISGQSYLRRFYEGLGFQVCSEEYMEDDIPHFEMFLDLENQDKTNEL